MAKFDRQAWLTEQIKTRRQELDLSFAELAKAARTTPRTIEMLEEGKGLLSSNGTGRVLGVLGIDWLDDPRLAATAEH